MIINKIPQNQINYPNAFNQFQSKLFPQSKNYNKQNNNHINASNYYSGNQQQSLQINKIMSRYDDHTHNNFNNNKIIQGQSRCIQNIKIKNQEKQHRNPLKQLKINQLHQNSIQKRHEIKKNSIEFSPFQNKLKSSSRIQKPFSVNYINKGENYQNTPNFINYNSSRQEDKKKSNKKKSKPSPLTQESAFINNQIKQSRDLSIDKIQNNNISKNYQNDNKQNNGIFLNLNNSQNIITTTYLKNIENLRNQVDHEISINRQIAKSVTGYLQQKRQYSSHRYNAPHDRSVNTVNVHGRKNSLNLINNNYIQMIEELRETNKQLNDEIYGLKNLLLKVERQLTQKQRRLLIQNQQLKIQIYEQKSTNLNLIKQLKQQIIILTEQNQVLYKSKNLMVNKTQNNLSHKNQYKGIDILQQIKALLNVEYLQKTKKPRIQNIQIDMIPHIEDLVRRNTKLQAFVNSLQQMKMIVSKQQNEKDIKLLWRWLKSMVEQKHKSQKFIRFYQDIKQYLNLQQISFQQAKRKIKRLVSKHNK